MFTAAITALLVGAHLKSANHLSQVPVDQKGAPAVAEIAKRFLAEQNYPGVWVAVARKGRVIGACAVGFSDPVAKRPAKLADRVRWGSISKTVVGTVAAEVVRQGQIGYGDRLFSWLPQVASQANTGYQDVTLDHLLSHSAGFERDGIQPKTSDKTSLSDVPQLRWDMLVGSIAKPPKFAPSKSYLYSNIGITLAAMMLEKASGKQYEELLATTANGRWQLSTMGTGEPPKEFNTTPFQFRNEVIEARPPGIDWRYSYLPAASVFSSIEDMCKFGLLHCSQGAFSSEMLSTMHEVLPPENTTRACFKRVKSGNGYLLHHGGALSNRNRGDVAWIMIEPATATVVAVYTNVCDENKASGENLVLTALNVKLSRALMDFLRR